MKEKEYYCVLVSPKKYREILERVNGSYYVKPPKQMKTSMLYGEVETLYSLPIEISDVIEEDMKFVTKEEYDEIKQVSMKSYEQFMKEYVSDEMFKAGW